MSTTELIYREECYQIMGACFDVYRDKGNGFLEAVYQECLCFELAHHQVPFEEQPTLELTYKGHQLKQTYMPDFLCFGEVIVEIKAIRTLTDEHRAQVINYLKASGKRLGLLVNFGSYPKATWERLIL